MTNKFFYGDRPPLETPALQLALQKGGAKTAHVENVQTFSAIYGLIEMPAPIYLSAV